MMQIIHQTNDANQKTKVSFVDQAVRNLEALIVLENAFDAHWYKGNGNMVRMTHELTETANLLAEVNQVNVSKPVSFKYNPDALKKNKNDYLYLQTHVVHNMGEQLEAMDLLPDSIDLDAFDTNKIFIEKHNAFGSLFVVGERKEKYALAQKLMDKEIAEARGRNAVKATAYYGMDNSF